MQVKGYVLVSGLILLFLASLLTISEWNTARFSYKAAANYSEKMVAKRFAYVALQKAEEEMEIKLKESGTLKDWVNQEATKIDPQCKKPPHFSVKYLGQKNNELFYFQVKGKGWSCDAESHQVLNAFYQFKKGPGGRIEDKRRALYVS